MCGIIGYWATDSVPSPITVNKLLEYGEKRGTDSFGFAVYNKQLEQKCDKKYKGQVDREYISNKIVDRMEVGSLMLANYRAAPETEPGAKGDTTIQPITMQDYCLVHNGAVSRKIYNELSRDYQNFTELDSEAILWAYLKYGKDMKAAMEYLSGGFAFLLLDNQCRKLFAVCTHNPLYCGYVVGHGLFLSSFSEAIYEAISAIKGTTITRQNIMVWEDYYCREFPANTITEFQLDSGAINEIKFTPRYIHPKYDPFIINKTINRQQKKKVLVSASGGLDSSTTLAILRQADYDVTAIHFKYGHRGEKAEELAITNICRILNVPMLTFDLREQMKLLDKDSMLVNKDHKITTGTEDGSKSTVAWTCFRNGFFATYMGAMAESLIINNEYNEVYLTGGFLNLSESGSFPDNSERFIKSFTKFCKFASIVGTKIKPLFCCSNLLKTELYIILENLGLLKILGKYMVSCDRPMLITDKNNILIPANCSKDGMPACGSGARSYLSAKRIGIEDPRTYYEVKDEDYKSCYTVDPDDGYIRPSINTILDKLLIHHENLEILKEVFTK